MKVAITGASGYVGSGLSKGFQNHGHEVLALSRRPCTPRSFSYSLDDDPRQLPWEGVDVLIHSAYDFTLRTWQEILKTNINASIALLQAAREAGVRHLVFISSMSAFDGCRSNYGKAKRMIEKEALALGAVVIRPGLVWGESSGGIMGTFEKLVARLPLVPFIAGGECLHQYLIHEADLSEAVIAIAGNPSFAGSLFSVAHPTPVSIHAILQTIARRSRLSRAYCPVPWQLVMAGLKCTETLGLPSLFRSDSLTGIVHGYPGPAITAVPGSNSYRPFQ